MLLSKNAKNDVNKDSPISSRDWLLVIARERRRGEGFMAMVASGIQPHLTSVFLFFSVIVQSINQ